MDFHQKEVFNFGAGSSSSEILTSGYRSFKLQKRRHMFRNDESAVLL